MRETSTSEWNVGPLFNAQISIRLNAIGDFDVAVLPRIPGYRLQSQLGIGGMGVVYYATRDDNDFKYAIKMLLPGRSASIGDLARFRIEAEAYACLNHPNIIKIRDVGVVSGCPFIAMDFAEKGSLSHHLASSPSLDINWRVKTIKTVADALCHAHGRRILHRDLKPGNILISTDGSPRVSDFGLVKFTAPISAVSESCCTLSIAGLDPHLLQMANESRHILATENTDELIQTMIMSCADRTGLTGESFNPDAMRAFVQRSLDSRRFAGELSPLVEDLTRAGVVMGSPQFMSPEQAEGRIDDIGPHTDVYGLGATLYQVVTGNPPIVGSNAWETVRNVMTQQPTQPHEINSSLSEDLSLVIMKSLDKNHHRRYASMEMFSEDLGRILEGRAPLARLNRLPSERRRVSVFQRFSTVISTVIFGSNQSVKDSAGTEP